MKNKYQHITETQCIELLKLLQKYEDLFDGTLGTWKTYLVKFKRKEDMKTMFKTTFSTKFTQING